MRLCVVIPTFNEEKNIAALVQHLYTCGGNKTVVVVSDGGSTDATVQAAAAAGAVVLHSAQKGRAAQMNNGAAGFDGDVLYFVHADTFPPPTFYKDIEQAYAKGFDLGRYRTRFLSEKLLLRLNEWFTRFDLFICMGGDQTLFVRTSFFKEQGGYKNDMLIMEEYEFCARARAAGGRYIIMNGAAKVSARKYDNNSWLQVQLANRKAVQLYRKGASQQVIAHTYKCMLHR